jgi:menaquinone-dependent protoporphyrinogen oxidase
MSKILVAYATKTGCTAGIAEKIGETLAATGATVDVKSVKDRPDPAGYDAVLVGSGARMGKWHGSASKWVQANAPALKGEPVAFYTACLTMAREPDKADEVRAYTDPVIEESGVEPVDVGLFAGWFEPDKFGVAGRTVLKRMDTPTGDFRDWDAIAAWTEDVAPKLGVGEAA